MPPRIPRPCRAHGCPKTTVDKSGYCDKHIITEGTWTKYHNGRSRHQRGYGSQWDKLRAKVLKSDKYLCQCDDCKRLGLVKPANEVDHIIAKAHGGTDDLSNLRAINHECHKRKTATERFNR